MRLGGWTAIVGREKHIVPTETLRSINGGHRAKSAFAHPIYELASLVPPLRLAHIHRAVGFFQRPAGFRLNIKDRYSGGCARGEGAAAKYEGEPIDRLFQ